MRDDGELRLLKLGVQDEDYCLIQSTLYTAYIQTRLGEGNLTMKVIRSLLRSCRDVSITREQLTEHKFSEDDIS